MQAVNLFELSLWTSVADHLLDAAITLKLGASCLPGVSVLSALELAQVSLGQAYITKGTNIRLITLPSALTC